MKPTRSYVSILIFTAFFFGFGILGAFAQPRLPRIFVNGVQLRPAKIQLLMALGLRPQPGRYWYDRVSGLWGVIGGPTQGQTLPGLELGGRLRANVSGGRTGVFINGRELHPAEVRYLQGCIRVRRGRFWMVANGMIGPEGGPPQANLVVLCRQAQARRSGRRGGDSWSSRSANTGIGGVGSGNFVGFIGKGWSVTVGD
jgi:hypothetical protein